MSLRRIIASMKSAGCSAEQIGAAVIAYTDGADRSPAAERQARYRDRVKGGVPVTRDITDDVTGDVTRDVTRDASPLPKLPPQVSPQEIYNQPPILPPSPIEPATARGKRLPEDWRPSEACLQVASVLGLSPEQTEGAVVEFKNYWLSESGQRARKISWDRTFQNRLAEVAPRILKGQARAGPRLVVSSSPQTNLQLDILSEMANETSFSAYSDR